MKLHPRLLRTDAGQAAAAKAWVEGMTQKTIAQTFNAGPPKVCSAILNLIQKYCPEDCTYSVYRVQNLPEVCGAARRVIAAKAVVRYTSSIEGTLL